MSVAAARLLRCSYALSLSSQVTISLKTGIGKPASLFFDYHPLFFFFSLNRFFPSRVISRFFAQRIPNAPTTPLFLRFPPVLLWVWRLFSSIATVGYVRGFSRPREDPPFRLRLFLFRLVELHFDSPGDRRTSSTSKIPWSKPLSPYGPDPVDQITFLLDTFFFFLNPARLFVLVPHARASLFKRTRPIFRSISNRCPLRRIAAPFFCSFNPLDWKPFFVLDRCRRLPQPILPVSKTSFFFWRLPS